MLKILIWQVSNDTSFKDKAIKILEQQHDGIEIIGEATADDIAKIGGQGDYDVLLVVGVVKISFEVGGAREIHMIRVVKRARELKLPEEKLLGDWIVCIPGFTLEKYRRLQRSQLSILSFNCFGGILSNSLNLPFLSPFVNLALPEKDFIKFLCSPHYYLEKKLKFEQLHRDGFPVMSLENILLNMVHYKTSEDAIEKWEQRKQRINWFNLFVVMLTTNPEILQQFDELPYGKKVCFVPFKSDLPSAWYINRDIDKEATYYMTKVNNFARGKIFYYDWFDMLLYGKKTPLIDM